MNAHTFTPGPWKVAADEPFVYALNEGGSNRFFLSVQGGWTIGFRNTMGDRTGIDELMAIARLIASAPDLLEALQEIVKSALEATDGQPGIVEMSNALEVIERATGREQ